MSLFKVFLGAIAVVICTFIGYKLSDKYKLRRQFYADFAAFNKLLMSEVMFTRKTIPDILSKGKYSASFKILTDEFLKSITEQRKISVDKLWFLTEQEREFAVEYFTSLGKTDAKTQIDYLSSAAEKLKGFLSVAETEERQYARLYVKLGFLAGLLVFVLIL